MTDSRHPYPVYPSFVNDRTPEAPDVIWVGGPGENHARNH